jgi:hypothetical protein
MNLRVIVSARCVGDRYWQASATGGVIWLRSRDPKSGATADDACERFAADVRERYPEHAFTFAPR